MDKSTAWAVVDAERTSLADLLETLPDDEWLVPSLCTGWTVRDVVAHLTLTAMGPGRATVELIRYRASLARTARETARRRAAGSTNGELVALLRGMVGNHGHLVGTSYLDPMCDVLVHGQDIAVPLRRERAMPVEAAITAATRVSRASFWSPVRRRLRGLRLEASDIEWSFGEGELVHGPIAVLLLVLTGRRVRLGELTGPGVARLAEGAPV
jgi:uncharacterized protein (TIGR03083 family)